MGEGASAPCVRQAGGRHGCRLATPPPNNAASWQRCTAAVGMLVATARGRGPLRRRPSEWGRRTSRATAARLGRIAKAVSAPRTRKERFVSTRRRAPGDIPCRGARAVREGVAQVRREGAQGVPRLRDPQPRLRSWDLFELSVRNGGDGTDTGYQSVRLGELGQPGGLAPGYCSPVKRDKRRLAAIRDSSRFSPTPMAITTFCSFNAAA
jgi:hypothetical protein